MNGLEELYSAPHLAELHRTMLMELMEKSKSSIYEARSQWQRQVVKFWFLDAAATSNGSDYATSILGMESELTITEFIPNDDDDDIATFDDEPQETGGLLKRPPYPALARQVVQQLEKMNEQPPRRHIGFQPLASCTSSGGIFSRVSETADLILGCFIHSLKNLIKWNSQGLFRVNRLERSLFLTSMPAGSDKAPCNDF